MEEDHPRVHADCGGQLQRIYQPATVIFKGGGFYQNDKALYGTTPGDYERE
jgi:predicted nucleic acid-binding Zn ribbon protein